MQATNSVSLLSTALTAVNTTELAGHTRTLSLNHCINVYLMAILRLKCTKWGVATPLQWLLLVRSNYTTLTHPYLLQKHFNSRLHSLLKQDSALSQRYEWLHNVETRRVWDTLDADTVTMIMHDKYVITCRHHFVDYNRTSGMPFVASSNSLWRSPINLIVDHIKCELLLACAHDVYISNKEASQTQ